MGVNRLNPVQKATYFKKKIKSGKKMKADNAGLNPTGAILVNNFSHTVFRKL